LPEIPSHAVIHSCLRISLHRSAVDLGNIIDYKNILRTYYDRDTNPLNYRYQMGFVPLLAFRVDFFAGRGRKGE